ncbi:mitotic apparatus protein p62 isoform X2 [Amphiprion ocellaris]|uniref:mitotic apparatus protein p62 isoform X2 n=1 Tax=Amphiprion ocellaris TaxID=80972 RepID=UPI000C30AFE8|nr:mitotic apparatus protein p62 isoform X2 [Amphiprion ocellaris]
MVTSWLTVLSSWLTVTLTAGGPTSVTVEPTCSLEAPPGTQLTLTCGENNGTGELRFWHTPFGDLQRPGFHSDAVVLQPDRSLLISNSSVLHSGFYYCLLQLKEEKRLQPYQLQVHTSGRAGDPEAAGPEKQQGVSDRLFAGAVAASVLITFVMGFSAGALTRTQVLRCFTAITMKLKSPQRRQPDIPDHGPEVAMTTLPPMCENQEMETVSSTTSSPPKKPQRSFRHKKDEETAEYLQGCDHKQDEGSDEEKVEGSDEQEVEGSDEQEVEGSDEQEVEGSDEQEVEGSDEEKVEGSDEEKVEGSDEQEVEGSDEKKVEGSDEEKVEGSDETSGFYVVGVDGGSETEDSDDDDDDDDDEKKDEDGQTAVRDSAETEADKNQEVKHKAPALRLGRRVICLYNYDDDGQRYQHLPDPAPQDPSPTPRLKQRSLSLTRLNAIMAAASASPLDRKETESDVRQRFHMEI